MSRFLSVLLLLWCLLATASAVSYKADVGYDALVAAINQANANGQACNGAEGCLGEPVTVKLNRFIQLYSPLPSLNFSAYLIVDGSDCVREGDKCPISGLDKFPIFVGRLFGPPPKLVLTNLVLFRAMGGALLNAGLVEATDVVFRDNTGGAVINSGALGGFPLQTYTKCVFLFNTGSAIIAGNGKYGLANNGTGFIIRETLFYKNTGDSSVTFQGSGGAAYLAGFGLSIFEDVTFENNTSPGYGGAVYADETNIIFRNVSFEDNVSLLGGGAVAGIAGFYQPLSLGFCNSGFANNSAPNNGTIDSISAQSYFQGTLPPSLVHSANATFCGTAVPEGSNIVGFVVVESESNCPDAIC